jgi:Uma2 family endonuclease
VMVVDERKQPVPGPYVVRFGGWTLERYLREAPESGVWEFVRGEVVVHSPASAEHQDLVLFLARLFAGYCEARGWGKVLMGPAAVEVLLGVVREPDVFVLPPEEVPNATGVPLRVKPVLVVEVTSPATRGMDLGEKAEEYRQAGVAEYWVVDGEGQELTSHRLRGGVWRWSGGRRGGFRAGRCRGFWVEVQWLWRRPLPPVDACLREVVEGT